jgi:hypothetical protein
MEEAAAKVENGAESASKTTNAMFLVPQSLNTRMTMRLGVINKVTIAQLPVNGEAGMAAVSDAVPTVTEEEEVANDS